ncbi:tetratricopeptide repeat protein [Azospirillum thermophilum]|nr:tetratricopeptide repeat protein [Azospirillum thermophilum]
MPGGLAAIGRNRFGAEFPGDRPIPEQCEWTVHRLCAEETLLIFDNAASPDAIRPWLPPSGAPCHAIVTSLFERWQGWPAWPVPPLSAAESRDLVAGIAGEAAASRHGDALVAAFGGLPVQLVPASAVLAKAVGRDRPISSALGIGEDLQRSYGAAYGLLAPDAQLLLHAAAMRNCQRIDRDALARDMADGAGWGEERFLDHLDACQDLHLMEGGATLRMHQLYAAHLLRRAAPEGREADLARIRTAQKDRMIAIAAELADAPARSDLADDLQGFAIAPDVWSDIDLSWRDYHILGRALLEVGQFPAALSWCQRAVAAAESGGIDGIVDQSSLGMSLHLVGICLSQQGQYDEAMCWYRRAVTAKEEGDIHGRIDQESLGRSLHEVGRCLSRQGRYDEALSWYQRAVTAAETGDIHGRVDQESLGRSLHEVGFCLSQQGQYDEAMPWYQRAVTAKEQGDIHCRVDQGSLGRSLHQIGYCLSQQERYGEAMSWFDRAVAAAGKGDIHGRVDDALLASFRQSAAFCRSKLSE